MFHVRGGFFNDDLDVGKQPGTEQDFELRVLLWRWRQFGAGALLVKGPNVMRGYLGSPDLTAQAIRDGWYVTGDIAAMDSDGFLTLTDRLSRFSSRIV